MFVQSVFHVKSLIHIGIFTVPTYQKISYFASTLSAIYGSLPAAAF